jgi:hypothetical protein
MLKKLPLKYISKNVSGKIDERFSWPATNLEKLKLQKYATIPTIDIVIHTND